MPDSQAYAIEQEIRARRAPGLFAEDAASELVLPDYGGGSLANVPATMAEILGATLPHAAPALYPPYRAELARGARRLVVFLLDALGYLQLRAAIDEQPQSLWSRLARQGMLLPMTSVVPSTTTTALVTLGTGHGPADHGLVGYEIWLREFGVLAEMIGMVPVYGLGKETLLDWGMEPEYFPRAPGMAHALGEQGVHTTALVPAQYTRSALSRMIYRGFDQLLGYYGLADMWGQVRQALADDAHERSLYLAYWGGLDTVIHRRGTRGGFWQAELQNVAHALEDEFLSKLSPHMRQDTLFVLIADHGFVETPPEAAFDTDTSAALRRLLAIPHSGEARASYLYPQSGDPADAMAAVQQILGPEYAVTTTDAALAAGLFGPETPDDTVRSRLGQLFVASRGQHYLDRQGKRLRLKARHGGLSAEEMLIPWLCLRLDG